MQGVPATAMCLPRPQTACGPPVQVAARHKLLRPLAVCLSHGHVSVTTQCLQRQAALLRTLLPYITPEQMRSLFLTNPLGLLQASAGRGGTGRA